MKRLFFSLIIASILVGCSSNSGQEITDLGDDPDDWSAHSFAEQPGLHWASVEFDDRQRRFAVYLPDDVDQRTGPLLFVFHGGGGDVERIRRVGFEEHADEDGGVIIYPEGVDGHWADGRDASTTSEQTGVDDVAFVKRLVQMAEANLSFDDDRVVATGASNGGMMSFRLACEAAEPFDVVAPVIAALPQKIRDKCNPAEPPSLVGVQGSEDPFIPIDGGEVSHEDFERLGGGGTVESAESTMGHFAGLLGCDDQPEVDELAPIVDDDPTRVNRHRFNNCSDDGRLTYYLVEQMGHVWPPHRGLVPRVSGTRSRQMDATETIWEFVQQPP